MSPRFSFRPLSSLGDRRLAELAAGGDERAFEVLVRRHRAELERYCRRLGLSEHRTEDVLQQSFTRAWVALRGGSQVGQPRPWLYRIVHNATANAHRSARLRRHEPIESAAPAVAAGDVETTLLARDTLRQVAELPQMQQRAVVMTAIEGRSHEEAAGLLGVSDGAVRGLVHRARTTLRAAAAALSPQGLLGLLSRAAGDGAISAPPVEAGAAGAGLAGLLSKGAAVTAVTGLLAGGAVVQLERHRHAADRQHQASGVAASERSQDVSTAGLPSPVVPAEQGLHRARGEGSHGADRNRASGRHGERHRGDRGRDGLSAGHEDSSRGGDRGFGRDGLSGERTARSGRRDGGERNRSSSREDSGAGRDGGSRGGGSALRSGGSRGSGSASLSGGDGGSRDSGAAIPVAGAVSGPGDARTADDSVAQVDASSGHGGGSSSGSDQAVRNPG
jgi:RNA polymerase sigma factor (sigma-70 family)